MTIEEALTTLLVNGCRFTLEADAGNDVRLTLSRPGRDVGQSNGDRVELIRDRGPMCAVLQRAAQRVKDADSQQ